MTAHALIVRLSAPGQPGAFFITGLTLMKKLLLIALLGIATGTAAQTTPPTLTQRLETAQEGSFERGTLETLRAVEGLLQTQYQYGIGRGFGRFFGMHHGRFANPEPESRTPTTFAEMIRAFAADLEAARGTLARTSTETAEPFELVVTDLWFDINRNGVWDEGENVSDLLLQFAVPRTARPGKDETVAPITVRFDGADHAWLTAYTHMLSGVAEGILAFDPSPIFADLLFAETLLAEAPTIPNTYDADAILLKITALKVEQEELKKTDAEQKQLANQLREQDRDLQKQLKDLPEGEQRDALKQKLLDLKEQSVSISAERMTTRRLLGFVRNEIRAHERKLPLDVLVNENASEAQRLRQRQAQRAMRTQVPDETRNAIYALFKALETQPDPIRIARARDHWLTMLAQNRMFWEALERETDNDREWIANPNQTSALGITLDEETIRAWTSVLDDAQAVLEGRLLAPHPFLPEGYGIDVSAWFDDPSPIDLVSWLHGRAAIPYAARGPRITNANWLAFQRMTQGNARNFALYFN